MSDKYVLVCDDDEGIVDVVTIVLSGRGYDVESVFNGQALLDNIKTRRPDVILLDLWMPGISGEQVARELKRSSDHGSIPVIIVSASKDATQTAAQTGADGFLLKPFDIYELERMVDKFAGR